MRWSPARRIGGSPRRLWLAREVMSPTGLPGPAIAGMPNWAQRPKHGNDLSMFASRLAPWLTRQGVHYGWVMVAITFLTTVCSSAATSLAGILVLPLIQEFGWGRGDISA